MKSSKRWLLARIAVVAGLAGLIGTMGASSVDATGVVGPGAKLTLVGKFTNKPIQVVAPPGDPQRFMVVGKNGRVEVVVNGVKQAAPFLDLTGQVGSGDVGGLLALTFAPDYFTSRRFYVHYTQIGTESNYVVEYLRSTTNQNVADASTKRVLLTIDQPHHNHPGGGFTFGPDGLLYIAVGDGGVGFQDVESDPDNNAQRLDTLKGKVLRIDPTDPTPGVDGAEYSIPATNPFVGVLGAMGEVFDIGLRNPWRIAFDSATGEMFIGDPGDSQREEVDVSAPGAAGLNFGWSCWEGTMPKNTSRTCPNPVFPAQEYTHQNGRCAVIGGVVSRDPQVPYLLGRYLYGDYCSGEIWSFKMVNGFPTTPPRLEKFGVVAKNLQLMSSFGEDGAHHVYVMRTSGNVYRFDPCKNSAGCSTPG